MSKIFCQEPFQYCEIYENGDVYVCCDVWCGFYPIGNIFEESLYDIWHSTNKGRKAKFIQQFIDQNFEHCHPDICLHQKPCSDESFEKLFQKAQKDDKIKRLRLNFDSTCNIKCVFCRNRFITQKENMTEQNIKLKKEVEKVLPYLNECHTTISFCGVGEFLCSEFHTDLIQQITNNYENINFAFVTNGLLCTEENFKKYNLEDKIEIINVSIHATKPETYEKLCIGGDFNKIKENLKYLSRLKNENKIKTFYMDFVITSINYAEMSEFAKWAFSLGATPQFLKLIQFPNYEDAKLYEELDITNPNHKEYKNFLKYMQKPVLKDKRIKIAQQFTDLIIKK